MFSLKSLVCHFIFLTETLGKLNIDIYAFEICFDCFCPYPSLDKIENNFDDF